MTGNSIRTSDVDESAEFTEEISICPEVVMFEIGVHVVGEKFLLELLFHFGDYTEVQIHPQGGHLSGLPIFPQPSRHVEQDRLRIKDISSIERERI